MTPKADLSHAKWGPSTHHLIRLVELHLDAPQRRLALLCTLVSTPAHTCTHGRNDAPPWASCASPSSLVRMLWMICLKSCSYESKSAVGEVSMGVLRFPSSSSGVFS